MAQPFERQKHLPLPLSEVERHLHEFECRTSRIPAVYPPVKPKAGDVFCVYSDQDCKRNDWRCDQYCWFQNGCKLLPRSNPVLKKFYFNAVTSSGVSDKFKKTAYHLINNDSLVLIQYLGDDTVAEEFPHGNTRNTNKPHARVCPSVISKIKASDPSEAPSRTYKKELATSNYPSQLTAVLKPSSTRQVTNVKAIERQKFRLSHDGLYNLHEVAYDLGGYISKITTYPDLVVICALPNLIAEIKRVLTLSSEARQLLSYDTTFQLGDFYVSLLLFRHTIFDGAPVIPLAFLIHERKLQSSHDEFMKFVASEVPQLANCHFNRIPIVTDEEKAICSAIDGYLPGTIRLRCWNHTFSAVRYWLKAHGATAVEIPFYIENMRVLFHSESEEVYQQHLSQLKEKWSKPFEEYFMERIHPDVVTSIGRWILEPLSLYNPYSGITTNQAEGFNTVLKRLQLWREVPIDSLVLSLYQLQSYYFNEIQRGLCNLGNYSLLSQYVSLARPSEEVVITSCISPEDIVQSIRSKAVKGKELKTEDDFAPQHVCEKSLESPCSSQMARANLVVKENRISCDTKTGTFVIVNTEGQPNVVRLFPSSTCSCAATGGCDHIMAAKISIGIEPAVSGSINLTQLRKNTRGRKGKKSGRKRPRPYDCHVYPAPDSTANTKLFVSNVNTQSTTLPQELPFRLSITHSQTAACTSNISPELNNKDDVITVDDDKVPTCILKEKQDNEDDCIMVADNKVPTCNLKKKQKCDPSLNDVKSSLKENIHPRKKSAMVAGNTCKKKLSLKTTTRNVWKSFFGFGLRLSHKQILLSNNAWLDDIIITVAQVLLKSQHPNLEGFQPTTYCQNLRIIPPGKDFLQIIHIRNNHWITISTLGCHDSGTVRVYDSLLGSRLNQQSLRLLSHLMSSQNKEIVIEYVDVHKQAGSYDCGLFAVAYLTSLCNGKNPASFQYDQRLMRNHLLQCFEVERLTDFPSISSDRVFREPLLETHGIHCICRRIDDGTQMIQCDNCEKWYHTACITVDKKYLVNSHLKWFCIVCKEFADNLINFLEEFITNNKELLVDLIHNSPFSVKLRGSVRDRQELKGMTLGSAMKNLTQKEIEHIAELLNSIVDEEVPEVDDESKFRLTMDVLFSEVYIRTIMDRKNVTYEGAYSTYLCQ